MQHERDSVCGRMVLVDYGTPIIHARHLGKTALNFIMRRSPVLSGFVFLRRPHAFHGGDRRGARGADGPAVRARGGVNGMSRVGVYMRVHRSHSASKSSRSTITSRHCSTV